MERRVNRSAVLESIIHSRSMKALAVLAVSATAAVAAGAFKSNMHDVTFAVGVECPPFGLGADSDYNDATGQIDVSCGFEGQPGPPIEEMCQAETTPIPYGDTPKGKGGFGPIPFDYKFHLPPKASDVQGQPIYGNMVQAYTLVENSKYQHYRYSILEGKVELRKGYQVEIDLSASPNNSVGHITLKAVKSTLTEPTADSPRPSTVEYGRITPTGPNSSNTLDFNCAALTVHN